MSDTSPTTDQPVRNGADAAPAAQPIPAALPAAQDAPGPNQTKVIWDDASMSTTFANVVNVLSTREEMAVLFGTNQTWNALETKELTVQLSNRIVLTPYAAKRLMLLLTNRIRDYESRFGTLNL